MLNASVAKAMDYDLSLTDPRALAPALEIADRTMHTLVQEMLQLEMTSAEWSQTQLAGRWGGCGLATLKRKSHILHVEAMTRTIPIVKKRMAKTLQQDQ